MKLTSAQLEQFDRDGYLFFPSLFTPEEIKTLTDEVPALYAQHRPENVREKGSDAVRTNFAAHMYSAPFARLARHPRMIEPVVQVFGEPVYMHQFKINGKMAFDGDVWQWHQDFGTWFNDDQMPEARAMNVAIFLDEVNEFNGPLMFIPGSHTLGVLDAGHDTTTTSYPLWTIDHETITRRGARGRERRRALVKLRRAESLRPRREVGARPGPAQPVDGHTDRRVGTQQGELPKPQGELTLPGERRGQARRSAHGHVPLEGELRNLLEVLVAGQHRGGGPGAPAGQAGVPVGVVADERQPVGNRRGPDAELLLDSQLVPQLARAAIELDDTVTAHALRQVLVRRADDDLLDARVGGGHGGRGGERVVGLELDHGPDHHAERAQRVLERLELGVEHGIDALARLVTGPQRVAKRFDDVIGGHAQVGRAALEHAEDRPDDTADRAERLGSVPVEGRPRREEVAGQLG